MQLEKIKNTSLLVVGFVFAVFGVWGITSPVDQELTKQLIQLVFILIGSILEGVAYQRIQLAKVSAEAVDFNRIRETGFLVISTVFSIFGIWQLSVPVDEQLVTQFFSVLITLISLFFAGSSGLRVKRFV